MKDKTHFVLQLELLRLAEFGVLHMFGCSLSAFVIQPSLSVLHCSHTITTAQTAGCS